MPTINIDISNKIAKVTTPDAEIVCGNNDYTAKFSFDDEWSAYAAKTAVLRYSTPDGKQGQEVVFTGDSCPLPALYNLRRVNIGVFAGDIRTTTAAVIRCRPCVTDGDSTHAAPPEDVYNQIIDLINNGAVKGDKGDKGEQGPQGVKGDTGDTGAAGSDGVTPTIGANGNWYIGSTDTGKPSRGEPGITPHIGENENWWLGEQDTGLPSRGEQGKEGHSPVVTATKTDDITTVLIDDKKIAQIKDGESAYTAAQAGGYAGTKTDFYADLAAIENLATELSAI